MTAVASIAALPQSKSLDQLDVEFEDITYTVRTGIFKKKRRTVLDGISGQFRSGELSVIVGQSGAGKSTLLDILAGYRSPASGKLLLNGRERDDKFFRRRCCYIMQNDLLQPLLTVHEAMTVAAELKLGSHVDHEQRKLRVKELIEALKLGESRDVRTECLSGGQKKRLAVGLELISDPPVMFFDEPTSGLDSSTSKQVVSLLRCLARQGRTLVVTMHQPSTPLLQLMDRIYAVNAGRCSYIGAVSLLVPYMDDLGLRCPPYHNYVDFLIEVSTVPELSERLVSSCQNGKNTNWLTSPVVITEVLDLNNELPVTFDEVTLTALPRRKTIEYYNKLKLSQQYPTSFWKQLTTLFLRTFKVIMRDPSLTTTKLGTHCAIALLAGTLYYNIGNDANYMRDNYNFYYFSLMFLMFTAFSGVTITFPCDLPIVRREHFNRWYSTGAYYASSLLASMPIQIACSVMYSLIAYWMTGQPADFVRFTLFTFMLTLTSLVAMCLGFLNGCIFDVKNGVVFGPFFIMPFTIFSGYFLSYIDAPTWIRWMFSVSFLKHSLVGVTLSVLGGERGKMDCTADDNFCFFINPKTFLEQYNMENEVFSMAVFCLYIFIVTIVLSAYFILRFRLRSKR